MPMNGFSYIAGIDNLIGAELIQVCIGANEIILNFWPDGIRISIWNAELFIQSNSFMFEPLITGHRRRIRQIGKTVESLDIINSRLAVIKMLDGSEI
jgi:hypothetical protein